MPRPLQYAASSSSHSESCSSRILPVTELEGSGETTVSGATPSHDTAVAPHHHSTGHKIYTGRADNHGVTPGRDLFANLRSEFSVPDERQRPGILKPNPRKKTVLRSTADFNRRRALDRRNEAIIIDNDQGDDIKRSPSPCLETIDSQNDPNGASTTTDAEPLPLTAGTTFESSVDNVVVREELQCLFEQLDSVKSKHFDYLKSSLSNTEEHIDLRLIYRAFKKLRKEYKNKGDVNAEICEIGYKRCRYFWFLNERAKSMEKEYQKLYPYGEPGAYKGKIISLGAGLDLGFGINVAGTEVGVKVPISFGVSKEKSYSQDDEGFFYPNPQFHSASLSAGAGFGLKLSEDIDLSSSATGSTKYFRQKGYEYGDVKDYIKHKGFVKIKREPIGLKARIACVFKKTLTRDNFISSSLEAINAQDRINVLLEGKDLSNVHSVPLPQRALGTPFVLNGVSADVSAQANAQANIDMGPITLQQGLGVKVKQEFKYFDIKAKSKYNLVEYIKKKSAAASEDKINDAGYQSIFSGKLKEKIKTFNNGQAFFLDNLKSDLEAYCSIVRAHDWSKSYSYTRKVDRVKIRNEKHKMEEKWGATGRDEFLRNIWFALGSLYEETNAERAILNQVELDDFVKKLESPNMAYNYEKILDTVYATDIIPLTIRDIRSELGVSLAQFKGTFELLHRKRVHPNVLREGEYLDLVITGEANASIASLFGSDEFKTVLDQFVQASNLQLPSDFLVIPNVEVSGNISYRMRFFKPKYSEDEEYDGQQWRHQLNRITTTKTAGGNLSMSSPVAGFGVSGSAGYQSQATKVHSENISHDDMTYLVLRYLRFYRNSELDNAAIGKDLQSKEWMAFYAAHKVDIHDIWKNMSNKNHPLYKEMKFFVDKYGDNTQWEVFLSLMDGGHVHINDANEDAIQKQFCTVVASLATKILDAHKSRWKSKDFKP